MKKILTFLVTLFTVSYLRAEVDGNPDLVPSIGLNFSGDSLEGTRKFTSAGLSAEQDGIYETSRFIIDGRLPINRSITLNASVGSSWRHWGYDETTILDFEDNEQRGTHFNIGVRFYIH